MMIDLPPADPGIEFSIASRGISKGLAQTEGPQVLPKAHVRIGKLQIGGQWKNVSSASADGEAAAFVNASGVLAGFQLSAGASWKFQTGVRGPADSAALELSGAVSRSLGKLGTRLSLVYSPDDLGTTGRSLYGEAGLSLDLGASTRMSASVARRERTGSPDYVAFNGGVTRTLFKGVALDLRYHDTNRSGLGEPYHGRVVASARLSF